MYLGPENRPQMNTRLLTIALALALLAAAVGNYMLATPATSETGNTLLTYGLELGRLLAWGLLVTSGTIIGTWYFKVIALLASVFMASVLFKLLHYSGASLLLWVSLPGIVLTYAVRFARKAHKGQFDVVKLVLVLVSGSSTLLLLLHLAPKEVRFLPPCLLSLAVLDFLYLENQKRIAGQDPEAR